MNQAYPRVSNKRSPNLLISEFFSTHGTFIPTPCLLIFLIFQVQIFSNMNLLRSSHIFLCQTCKKCKSFNSSLLMNALRNFNILKSPKEKLKRNAQIRTGQSEKSVFLSGFPLINYMRISDFHTVMFIRKYIVLWEEIKF